MSVGRRRRPKGSGDDGRRPVRIGREADDDDDAPRASGDDDDPPRARVTTTTDRTGRTGRADRTGRTGRRVAAQLRMGAVQFVIIKNVL